MILMAKHLTFRSAGRASACEPFVLALLLLQALDWHSTLSAGAGQYESNKLLNILATALTFPVALALVKGFDILAIFAMFWIARRKPDLSLVSAMLFASLVWVYTLVVVNNYLI